MGRPSSSSVARSAGRAGASTGSRAPPAARSRRGREGARLLKRGVALSDVLEASIALRRRGGHLAEARLTEGPSGALVREVAGQLAELSGQLTMRLPMRPEQKARSLDDLLVEAEEAEAGRGHATAESPCTPADRAHTADPGPPL